MLIIAIIYWSYPEILIAVDFDIYKLINHEIIKIIASLMAISAIFQIIEANRILLFGSLRVLKDTRFTMLISILTFWGIALPVGYLMAIKLNFGASGYWWSMIFGASISVLLLQWRFDRKIDRVVSHQNRS